MDEAVEKKLPVRNMERIGEKKFMTYEEAKVAQTGGFYGLQAPDKVKIVARYDGTFDVIAYKKIEAKKDAPEAEAAPKQYESKSMERRAEAEKRHGLKAKDRRKAEAKKKA